jgi:hypothetical protein
MDFVGSFFVTASVNKIWLLQLIEALTVAVFNAVRLRKQF